MVWLEPLAAGAAVVIADQLSKHLVVTWQGLRDTSERRPIFAIHCILNRRAAVMRLRARGLLVGLWMACAALAWWSLMLSPPAQSAMASIGVGLVVGGVTGNLIDRLQRGGIVDFIAIRPWVFNLADIAIVGGLVLLLLVLV